MTAVGPSGFSKCSMPLGLLASTRWMLSATCHVPFYQQCSC